MRDVTSLVQPPPLSETYKQIRGTNQYSDVGGSYDSYDGNGNLTRVGWFVYKYDYYDYLDHLCEVYLTTYPGGGTLSASSGGKGSKSAKLVVLGPKIQMARKGKMTHFTQKQLETLIAKARAAERKTRSKTGKLLPSKGGSSTKSAGANEPVLELVA